ncbi:MAG: hypothetical protein P8Z00_02325 [Anaerolineales bacterium]
MRPIQLFSLKTRRTRKSGASAKVRPAILWLSLLLALALSACQGSLSMLAMLPATPSPTQTTIAASTATHTAAPSQTAAPTPTIIPSLTPTPTVSPTPTITFTPTPDIPSAITIKAQAFCRYGPGKAYLYSHGLVQGDHVLIEGKSYSGTWLWVKPDDLNRHCWAAASVLEVQGDLQKVHVVQTRLPMANNLYGPPKDVQASRSGDQVLVTWKRVWMTKDDDRGYLIEANVCRDGNLIPIALHTNDTSVKITDDGSCSGSTGGKLYTVEKHGYVNPVKIPWP